MASSRCSQAWLINLMPMVMPICGQISLLGQLEFNARWEIKGDLDGLQCTTVPFSSYLPVKILYLIHNIKIKIDNWMGFPSECNTQNKLYGVKQHLNYCERKNSSGRRI